MIVDAIQDKNREVLSPCHKRLLAGLCTNISRGEQKRAPKKPDPTRKKAKNPDPEILEKPIYLRVDRGRVGCENRFPDPRNIRYRTPKFLRNSIRFLVFGPRPPKPVRCSPLNNSLKLEYL